MERSQSTYRCIMIALITYAQVKHACLTSSIRGRADAVYQCARRALFCADTNCPEGCIEELNKNPTADDRVLITTFERDSIWHYDGLVRAGQNEIKEAERKVRISNKT
jgi:hypothetical protein